MSTKINWTAEDAAKLSAKLDAARAMLAALNKVVTHWDDLHPKDRAQARAAIAAAEAAGIK